MFFLNVGNHLPDYTSSYSRQKSSVTAVRTSYLFKWKAAELPTASKRGTAMPLHVLLHSLFSKHRYPARYHLAIIQKE
jgi:hypothetical protein